MNDPHVDTLIYRVITDKDVDYDKAEPFSAECADFILSIDGQKALFKMKRHFAIEEKAKEVVDKFLQGWSVSLGLNYAPEELIFRFENAEIIDRNPPKNTCDSKLLNVCVSSTIHVSSSVSASIHISRSKFPPLPENFAVSPDVETMYLRYKIYREKKELLTSMAYMCLTILEAIAGDRTMAAQKYFISKEVLDKLGNLVSTRGSKLEARKMPKKGTLVPLKPKEEKWIEEVIKRIIYRVGEHAFDPKKKLPKITMSDFPSLVSD